MWIYTNTNPSKRNVGDCAIRAVSVALGIPWVDAYRRVAAQGLKMRDMPTSDAVWGAVLKQNGFRRMTIPNTCPDCYTANEFCRDNPRGTFVLGFGGHCATVIDGTLYDSWDSSREIPVYVWVRR